MKNILTIVQVILSLLLVLFVLLQEKGAGLGETFGGSSGFYASTRGVEKFLMIGTVVIAGLFCLNSLAFIFV